MNKRKNYQLYKELYIRGHISYNYFKYLSICVCIKMIIKNIILDLVIILALLFNSFYYINNTAVYALTIIALLFKIIIVYKKIHNIISICINNINESKQKRALYRLGEYINE